MLGTQRLVDPWGSLIRPSSQGWTVCGVSPKLSSWSLHGTPYLWTPTPVTDMYLHTYEHTRVCMHVHTHIHTQSVFSPLIPARTLDSFVPHGALHGDWDGAVDTEITTALMGTLALCRALEGGTLPPTQSDLSLCRVSPQAEVGWTRSEGPAHHALGHCSL